MPRYRLFLAAAAVLPASRAEAHAFQSGADHYGQFLEGAGVVLGYPGILLPLLALGILLSLWHPEGMPRAWPAFLVGQIAGIPVAAIVGAWVMPAMLMAGILVAALAALLPRHVHAEAWLASLILGLLAVAASLEGHGLLELPVFIHIGILFGANFAAACAAGLARLAMERVEAGWMRILWRVASSWLAAILTLFFAFSVAVS